MANLKARNLAAPCRGTPTAHGRQIWARLALGRQAALVRHRRGRTAATKAQRTGPRPSSLPAALFPAPAAAPAVEPSSKWTAFKARVPQRVRRDA